MAIGSTLVQSFTTIKYVFLYGWPFMILIWIFVLKKMWQSWPVDVVIIEKRGENLIKTNDRAGKFIDPYTGITGYKLRKAKDTVPIVNYDWVLHNVVVNETIFHRIVNLIRPTIGTLFFFRYGSKQYKPVKVKHAGDEKLQLKEMQDENGNPIMIKVYEQFDPRYKLGSLDFEVVDWDNMNFMVQEQRASMTRRTKKGEWVKQILIPLAIIAGSIMLGIVMIKFSYDYAVGLRSSGGGGNPSAPATGPDIPVIGDLVPGS